MTCPTNACRKGARCLDCMEWDGLVYEDPGVDPAEALLSPTDERAHGEFVRRVAAEHGFPLSDWTPKL